MDQMNIYFNATQIILYMNMIILRFHINSQLWVRSQFHNRKMKILVLVSLFFSLLDIGSGRHFQPEFGYLYGEMRTTEANLEKLDKMVMMCVKFGGSGLGAGRGYIPSEVCESLG